MEKISTETIVMKKNMLIMFASIIFFTFLLALDIIKFWKLHIFSTTGIAVDIGFLVVLFSRIQAKYTCCLSEKLLIFQCTGLLGKKSCSIPLASIMGVYHYQPELVGIMRFRHSSRFHSALDGRDVWTAAYVQINKKGKEENCRIFFKPDASFLKELNRLLPGKVTMDNKKVILADMRKAN
ncbi:hypothetical protein [Pectinatus haikarae]|uniref:Uncharacterized protein n=1 Tax=Pectinatus haikarae TaxID=349096 RepID=A0ABT9Y7X5_9FIRM|nr:hypothetical protein [Pectinatus haikarae]MDQ0203626.1 hypothetical protein [Pectinatus haikarae]